MKTFNLIIVKLHLKFTGILKNIIKIDNKYFHLPPLYMLLHGGNLFLFQVHSIGDVSRHVYLNLTRKIYFYKA